MAATCAAGAEDSSWGVVLMHGKDDAPPFAVEAVALALRERGYRVATPEMPWSARRGLDAPHAEAIRVAAAAAADLRAQGVQRIALGGHGLGGNTALAALADGVPAEALLLLAPAHTPERREFAGAVAEHVERARVLVGAGRGGERDRFLDFTHRATRPVYTSAATYWSYFDPEGSAAMSRSAAAIARPVPVLWVHGSRDVVQEEGRALFFERLPRHVLSREARLWTPFGGTPRVAAGLVTGWLESL